ncbi:MAG: hypothetical protein D3926_10560 [Desulfobacteraceae bacterium]|nr:MAG: hypothetical protein D3926_10560 [Desulfobacteraceae bacterium]
MNRISSHPPAMSQNQMQQYQASAMVQKQMVSAYESLEAGLTIQTREGDIVTLSSKSFGQLEARSYDSQGNIITPDGQASVSVSQREITLTSGQSFTFSVQGDLSEEELADIDQIIKGIDGIISEMAEGDMDDAVAKALAMEGYDTISQYAATLSYERAYQMSSSVQQAAMTGFVPEEEPALSPANAARIDAEGLLDKIREFFEDQLEAGEEKLLEKSRRPVNRLFDHHLGQLRENRPQEHAGYNALEQAKQDVDQWVENMLGKAFKKAFKQWF